MLEPKGQGENFSCNIFPENSGGAMVTIPKSIQKRKCSVMQ